MLFRDMWCFNDLYFFQKVKCHRYWPESGVEMHGPFQVILHAMHEYPEYTLREFRLIDSRVSYLDLYVYSMRLI